MSHLIFSSIFFVCVIIWINGYKKIEDCDVGIGGKLFIYTMIAGNFAIMIWNLKAFLND